MNVRGREDLGRRVRRIRLERGLTLKEVEAKAGISATHVSEVERGKTSPTIGVLARLAGALDVDPAFLIDVPDPKAFHLSPRGHRRHVSLDRGRIHLESLSDGLARSEMTAIVLTLPPDPAEPEVRAHDGEEFALVLNGCLDVHVDGEVVRLDAGDSVHFRAHQAHGVKNAGEVPCVVLWATCPKFSL
jgi:transcriptional regulator with XRE-family HTH domain